ncbi:MAG: cation:proton antiporter, partial [Candidatus Micrarchaeota archaeon]
MIEFFFMLGMVLVIGYVSYEFFELTRIPDVLLLMALGLLLGPVFGVVNASPGSLIASLAPLVGTVALVIILFDGGLNLNFLKVLKELGKASVFTVIVFALTALFTAVLMQFAFGWPFLHGLLLGFVVGGTSSAIVIPIVSRLVLGEEHKIILGLESALTDALCVVFALALIPVIKSGSVMLSQTAGQLASAFSIAIVIGAVAGFAWLGGLRRLHGRPFAYMLTLAIVFVLYAGIEFVGGNGAIGVLVFGLMLGNFGEIAKRAKIEGEFSL